MRESSQECFVPIIKNALDPNLFTENKLEGNKFRTLKRVIAEFEEEKVEIEN